MMSERHLLLCTDMDRTIIPNGVQPETPGVREWFKRLCEDERIELVYVTGRDINLVKEAIADYALPEPDYAITDVGTVIYQVRGGAWQSLAQWQELIAQDWHDYHHADLVHALAEVTELELQEQEKQNRFKLSYYLDLKWDARRVLGQMQRTCDALGVAVNIIWSIDAGAGVGLVDVLPQRASKVRGIRFLGEQLKHIEDEILFAGDSGNDLDVLESSIPAVLVANGAKDVRKTALERSRRNGHEQRLFMAGESAWPPGNGNYCSGVLQGVAHFFPTLRQVLERIVGQ